MAQSYEKAGVNLEAGYEVVRRIKKHVASTSRLGVMGNIGAFGGMFDLSALGVKEPVLVSGTDGVGTKLKLAFAVDKHDTIGIDAVAMCVNDVLAQGAEPLVFLDYVAVGRNEPRKIEAIVAGVAEGCRQAGCALVGGEMAEHTGVMRPDDYDMAGFTVGVVDRPKMLDPANVRPGDVIIGLPSSGIHSNGYSLVRRVIGVDGLVPGTPEAEAKRAELEQPVPELGGESLADALLAPTRIYVKPVLGLLRSEAGARVHAIAHITGGGITENLNRALAPDVDAVVERTVSPTGFSMGWDVPPVISYISRAAGLKPNEACKTFNMGAGLMVICPADAEDAVVAELEAQGERPFRVGTCVAGSGKVVYSDER